MKVNRIRPASFLLASTLAHAALLVGLSPLVFSTSAVRSPREITLVEMRQLPPPHDFIPPPPLPTKTITPSSAGERLGKRHSQTIKPRREEDFAASGLAEEIGFSEADNRNGHDIEPSMPGKIPDMAKRFQGPRGLGFITAAPDLMAQVFETGARVDEGARLAREKAGADAREKAPTPFTPALDDALAGAQVRDPSPEEIRDIRIPSGDPDELSKQAILARLQKHGDGYWYTSIYGYYSAQIQEDGSVSFSHRSAKGTTGGMRFEGLNALMKGTSHSERRFLEATEDIRVQMELKAQNKRRVIDGTKSQRRIKKALDTIWSNQQLSIESKVSQTKAIYDYQREQGNETVLPLILRYLVKQRAAYP